MRRSRRSARESARVSALQHPVQLDVLPAREVGVEASAELQQRADPAAGRDPARRRHDDPRDQPQQRRLPRPVAADRGPPIRRARSASDTSRSAHTSCAPVRPWATSSSFSVCVSRARTTNLRETPSTWISPGLRRLRGHGRELVADDPCQHVDERGVGVRHLDPREPEAGSARGLPPPRRDPTGSRDGRRRTRPDRRALRDPSGCERVEVVEDVRAEPRLARRRLALERERPVVRAPAPRRRAATSRAALAVRVAGPRGSEPEASGR